MYPLVLHVMALVCLAGCVSAPGLAPGDGEFSGSPWTQASGIVSATNPVSVLTPVNQQQDAWVHFRFPGKKANSFHYASVDGRDAMAVSADSSASMLRKKLRLEPDRIRRVHFSWKLPALIPAADMGDRDLDDAPVRVVLAFDGDRSTFSTKNAMLNELTRALTGEEMPYAVLMYVWSKQKPVGTVIPSPRTDRIRKLVIETGASNLSQWMAYERDIVADFQQVYGERPGALIGMGVMTDTDNTQTKAQAWYGPVQVLVD